METVVKNPKSGRMIKVGGTLYKNLVQEGVVFDSKRLKKKKFVPVLDKQVKKKDSINPSFDVDRSDVKWGEKKPHSRKERKLLHERCGDDAFCYPRHSNFQFVTKLQKKTTTVRITVVD